MPTHAIIGGGAAGVFGAIQAKRLSPHSKVILLEKTQQPLSKVRISGGGRCNVTHACFEPARLAKHYPRGEKELIGPFHAFGPRDTVAWFEREGIRLKTENDGRMFPETDSSETIIDCLLGAALHAGVELRKGQKVRSVERRSGRFAICQSEEELIADTLLLASGSSSWGHELARGFGHTVIDPVPSLFTFNVPSSPLLDLAGISVPNAMLEIEGLSLTQQGPLLLTHWGFSGPAALKLSAWAARELNALEYRSTLKINWTGAPNCEVLFQGFLKQKEESPRQPLHPILPANLFARLLGKSASLPVGQLSRQALHQIAAKLYSDPYPIEGKTTYKQEFVTAGGVSLNEISFKTMESRIVPGLYFAGEVLDVDGITGGFNFQNAWTTGFLAGSAMAQKDKTHFS